MLTMKQNMITVVAVLGLLFPACSATRTSSPKASAPRPSEREPALRNALRTMAGLAHEREDVRAFIAYADLNTDGVDEAVVHLTGQPFCGSGGCTTLVYQWDAKTAGYLKIHHSPTTRPPIYASKRVGCPWSTLWVQRSGGGRPTALHTPSPLSEVDSCDAPVGTWSEAESKLLIPVYDSQTEGTTL